MDAPESSLFVLLFSKLLVLMFMFLALTRMLLLLVFTMLAARPAIPNVELLDLTFDAETDVAEVRWREENAWSRDAVVGKRGRAAAAS